MIPDHPDPPIMAAAERLAGFIAGVRELEPKAAVAIAGHVLAAGPVTIVENFAPFLFEGQSAGAAWAEAMRAHVQPLTHLRHEFGPPQDFSVNADRAFFTLPTTWRGELRGRAFTEHGGWALVLVRQGEEWRVRGYGWAVTAFAFD